MYVETTIPCERCDGERRVHACSARRTCENTDHEIPCPDCEGKGRIKVEVDGDVGPVERGERSVYVGTVFYTSGPRAGLPLDRSDVTWSPDRWSSILLEAAEAAEGEEPSPLGACNE